MLKKLFIYFSLEMPKLIYFPIEMKRIIYFRCEKNSEKAEMFIIKSWGGNGDASNFKINLMLFKEHGFFRPCSYISFCCSYQWWIVLLLSSKLIPIMSHYWTKYDLYDYVLTGHFEMTWQIISLSFMIKR